MRYGFIYKIIKVILDSFNYLNLVELFKIIAVKLIRNEGNDENIRTYARIGIDIFICLKWFFVFIIWKFHFESIVLSIIVWYLIITNVYSYFYNHIWTDEALNSNNFTKDRIRSRFINLLLAFAFSIFSFGYLYQIVYYADFKWNNNSISFVNSIHYSILNSLGKTYEFVQPITQIAVNVSIIQLVITFIFITIILSKSIPQTNSKI